MASQRSRQLLLLLCMGKGAGECLLFKTDSTSIVSFGFKWFLKFWWSLCFNFHLNYFLLFIFSRYKGFLLGLLIHKDSVWRKLKIIGITALGIENCCHLSFVLEWDYFGTEKSWAYTSLLWKTTKSSSWHCSGSCTKTFILRWHNILHISELKPSNLSQLWGWGWREERVSQQRAGEGSPEWGSVIFKGVVWQPA